MFLAAVLKAYTQPVKPEDPVPVIDKQTDEHADSADAARAPVSGAVTA